MMQMLTGFFCDADSQCCRPPTLLRIISQRDLRLLKKIAAIEGIDSAATFRLLAARARRLDW